MEQTALLTKIKEQIVQCEAEFEQYQDDTFLSYVLAEKRRTLQHFWECLQTETDLESFKARLEEKLPQLEAAKKEEEEHPTFDWYDEHYHYKVLEGICDAYRCVLKLL